jgi:hypothetical protein
MIALITLELLPGRLMEVGMPAARKGDNRGQRNVEINVRAG